MSTLSPKKFYMYGQLRLDSYGTSLNLHVFQSPNAGVTCQNVVNELIEMLGIQSDAGPITRALDYWKSDNELLELRKEGFELKSNGAATPSCSLTWRISNPEYDKWADTIKDLAYNDWPPRPSGDGWGVSFKYKSGKWQELKSYDDTHKSTHPAGDEFVRRLRELHPELS